MKRRPRKRTLLMVLLLLAGGAIINVAVAWGFAQFLSIDNIPQQFHLTRIEPRSHLIAWQAGPGYTKVVQIVSRMRLRHSVEGAPPVPWYITPPTSSDKDIACSELYAGWPYRSVSCINTGSIHAGNNALVGLSGEIIQGGWAVELRKGLPTGDWRALPYTPIVPGFAINTIFYAAILWLLVAALHPGGFVRRRIRARRGQCPACGYPIGSSNVCTECGRTVTR